MPPIKLIPASLRQAKLCHARDILLVPQWPSSHFWSLLHNGIHFKPFIEDYWILPPYYTSSADGSIFKGFVSFNAIAFRFNYPWQASKDFNTKQNNHSNNNPSHNELLHTSNTSDIKQERCWAVNGERWDRVFWERMFRDILTFIFQENQYFAA